MSSEEISMVPSQRLENGLTSPLVFQDDALRFNCGAPQRRLGDPGPKTRELTGFIDDKMFSTDRDRYFAGVQGADFRRGMFDEGPNRREPPGSRNWNGNGTANTPSAEESDGDEDDDEEDDDDDDEVEEGDGEVEGLVAVDDSNKISGNNSGLNVRSNNINNDGASGSVHCGTADKLGNGKPKHNSSFGSSRELTVTDTNVGQSVSTARVSSIENHRQGRLSSYRDAVTIADPDGDMYYSQYLQATDGSASGQKDLLMENGCGFSGRKDVSFSSESGEPLRAILSDPVSGILMDDAMILPCGHSFGAAGIQHILKTFYANCCQKACYTCSQPVADDSIAPNLSLRAAVQAFRREEELQVNRLSKRRRERFDQDKGNYGDSTLLDPPRGRGVQFPFVVTDRVIIKGNKRTPQRFVGREAVVTTQCLNGWYVVKTLDNAESVKLQYRSLAKISDNPSSKPISSKMGPSWL